MLPEMGPGHLFTPRNGCRERCPKLQIYVNDTHLRVKFHIEPEQAATGHLIYGQQTQVHDDLLACECLGHRICNSFRLQEGAMRSHLVRRASLLRLVATAQRASHYGMKEL